MYLSLTDALLVSCLEHISEFSVRRQALFWAELVLCFLAASKMCQIVFQRINASTATIDIRLIIGDDDRPISTLTQFMGIWIRLSVLLPSHGLHDISFKY